MFQEFKAFVMRGNVLDLAVAVIISCALMAPLVSSMAVSEALSMNPFTP